MLPRSFIKGYDSSRLRNLLAVLFLALAIPTAFLIWHAWGQLKWEAFHQYRGLAEELTRRIDARLVDTVQAADARTFADYSFLVVTGDPGVNFLQRSPLSGYPVSGQPPGLIGHFQVDTRGAFSSPLLPPAGSDPDKFGIGGAEYADRTKLARDIHEVLADNRLVQAAPATPRIIGAALEDSVAHGSADEYEGGDDASDRIEAKPPRQAGTYSQQVFDRLNQPRQEAPAAPGDDAGSDLDAAAGFGAGRERKLQQAGAISKVADLNLDSVFQKKSEGLERQSDLSRSSEEARSPAPARAKRKEQIALAESAIPAESEPAANAAADLRIRTFESEVDPLDFSMLDSGHLVLFRKVWREGERYIQGMLIDQQVFIAEAIDRPFMETALSGISHLIVA
ncbi:MAG: hypothetical protein KJO33_10240, partial [Gammaproteobacteria bacterium]|nr:hypothetical protein [Gammaproteobacteria bacterium]